MKHAFHRRLGRATEPQILFPLIAVIWLAITWGVTLGLVKIKHSEAERDAQVSSRELLGTYEAQVVRVLREIDQTLNLVKFWHERTGMHGALLELAFNRYDLHRVVGRCDGRNAPSIRSLEKAGLRQEAHFVENEFVKGEWTDEIVLAILRRDWISNKDSG